MFALYIQQMINNPVKILLLSLFSAFIITACDQEEENTSILIPQNIIKLEQLEKFIDYNINEFPVRVTANCQWSVSCEADWIEIKSPQEYYLNSKTLHLRTEKNTQTQERRTILHFTDGIDTTSLHIIQAAFEVYLNAAEESLSFGYRTAEKEVKISSNCGWLASTDQDWITIKPSTGLVGTYDMQIGVQTNKSFKKRDGHINIWNETYNKEISITVTQEAHIEENMNPYIDEYGVDWGSGMYIQGLIWAPVNSGYHKDDFKYGKMYQWGRKKGIGYSDGILDDKVSASISETWPGTNGEESEDTFYKSSTESKFGYDWIAEGDDTFWNLGTEENPVKNKVFDPCPEGWRIPTRYEFRQLIESNEMLWTIIEGQNGYLICDPEDKDSNIFIPAGGRLNVSDGLSFDRNIEGYYWTTTTSSGSSSYLYFHKNGYNINNQGSRAGGCLLRCIKE